MSDYMNVRSGADGKKKHLGTFTRARDATMAFGIPLYYS